MQIKYGVKFIVQKCIDLMQKVHDKNIEIMKTFLSSVKSYEEDEKEVEDEEWDTFTEQANEGCVNHLHQVAEYISDAYDEDFEDEDSEEEDEPHFFLKGNERAVFEYIQDQIQSCDVNDNRKNYSLNISSKEFQTELHLTAQQISRALRSLAAKELLTRRGYQVGVQYYYELTVPLEAIQ